MNIYDKINLLYSDGTYFSKYGLSMLLTLVIISIAIALLLYINHNSFTKYIKSYIKDSHKCDPIKLMFKKYLNDEKPKNGESASDATTRKNTSMFKECLDDYIKVSTQYVAQPAYFATALANNQLYETTKAKKTTSSFLPKMQAFSKYVLQLLTSTIKNISYAIAKSLSYLVASFTQGMGVFDTYVKFNVAIYEGIIMSGLIQVWNWIQQKMGIYSIFLAVITALTIAFISLATVAWWMWPPAIALLIYEIILIVKLIIEAVQQNVIYHTMLSSIPLKLNPQNNAPNIKMNKCETPEALAKGIQMEEWAGLCYQKCQPGYSVVPSRPYQCVSTNPSETSESFANNLSNESTRKKLMDQGYTIANPNHELDIVNNNFLYFYDRGAGTVPPYRHILLRYEKLMK